MRKNVYPEAFQVNSAKLKTLLFLGMLADLAGKNPRFSQG